MIEEPEKIEEEIAAAIGLAAAENQSLSQLIRTKLEDRRTLLILDNCEHLIEDAARSGLSRMAKFLETAGAAALPERIMALTTVTAHGYALTAGTADEASLLSGLGTACASLAGSLPATRNPNQLTQEKLYGQFAFPELPEAVHWFNPRELDWKMVLCVAGFAG